MGVVDKAEDYKDSRRFGSLGYGLLVQLHRTFLAIRLALPSESEGRGAEGDGSFRSPLFALRSPTRRPRRKRAVFDENQTALVKLHWVRVEEILIEKKPNTRNPKLEND